MRKFISATVGLILLIFFRQETEASARIVVTVDPQRSEVMSGERVRLTCEVKDSDPFTQWRLSWMKRSGGQEIALHAYTGEDSSVYTLNSVVESDSAQYTCEAKAGNQTITSSPYTLAVTPLPSAVLTVQPEWSTFYPSEKVTLTCEVQWGFRKIERRYVWYRDGTAVHTGTEKEFMIQALDQSHSGSYSCYGEILGGIPQDYSFTKESNRVILTVKALPSAILTAQPVWSTFYPSEKVTLTCEVQWGLRKNERSYVWNRDGTAVHTGTEKEFMIQTLDQSHSGSYSCVGVIPGRIPFRNGYTEESKKVTLTVDALPSAILTVQPEWSTFYPSEKVTLTCEVQWRSRERERRYVWYKDGTAVHTGTEKEFMILTLDQSHSGSYSCVGMIPGRIPLRNGYTEESKKVTLNVDALPSAVLTVQPEWSTFYPSEKVTLICEVQWRLRKIEKRYVWNRDGKRVHSGTEKEFMILTLDQSHSGSYSCVGVIPGRIPLSNGYTEESKKVTLTVDALPSAVLTVQPEWSTFYPSEKVTLTCEVQWGLRKIERRYVWNRDGKRVHSGTEKEFMIQTLDQSHSGSYSCVGMIPGRLPLSNGYTEESKKVTLTVDALPSAVLTIQPEWSTFYPSEKVTLTCEVQWGLRKIERRYVWNRDGKRVHSGTEKEFMILTLDQSHSGSYSCVGVIPGRIPLRKGYTEESKKVTLNVDGNPPKPLMTLDPSRPEIFTGDPVVLSCGVSGDAAGWQYQWYRGTRTTALTSTDSHSTDGSIYRISSAAESHRGEYWCLAVRGTPHFYTPHSDPLRLNITARPVAVVKLETPWTGIFRTDSLTLRCSVERNFTGWNYTWYRDGQPLKIGQDTLTLKPENGTDRSEYRCRGNSTGYPFYTDISEAFREHNIVLKRKVLVSVASTVLLGILIIILGCIALRVRRKSAYKAAPQNDLFISSRPSENLGSNSEHYSAAKPSADIEDACNIELYSVVDLHTEKEVLPPKSDPEELQSFKAIV